MPWQQQAVDVGLEIDPSTGRLAYRELVVTVMRQSGKSVLVLAMEVDRCVSWPPPQRVAYTAQTGTDAGRKLIDDHVPMLEASKLSKLTSRVYLATGSRAVMFSTGSRIDVLASSAAAGHGRTLDLGVIDEAFEDTDDRREQAILPAMATRQDAQLLVVSTAGTEQSTYLRRKVESGRAEVSADRGRGICYLEWSVPDDGDVDDPETWWQHMPALGWTISEDAVSHARRSMSDREFRRGFCNQWVAGDVERLIPDELWQRVQDPEAHPAGRLSWAFDVQPDRSSAAVAAVSGQEAELVDHRPGVSWLVDRLSDLQSRHGGVVRADGGGPGSSVLVELEKAGVPVEAMSNGQVIGACARSYDWVADGKLRVRPHPALDAAVAGLAKRPVGDRFVWSRSTSTADVTPWMAVTLALSDAEEPSRPFVILG